MIKAIYNVTSSDGTIHQNAVVSETALDDQNTAYALRFTPSTDTVDSVELCLRFDLRNAWHLSVDHRIVPLRKEAAPPPALVGCFVVIDSEAGLFKYELPPTPYFHLAKTSDAVIARFVVRDRQSVGLRFYGDRKIASSPRSYDLTVKRSQLGSLNECVWLEPRPKGARSVICLTDHPDWDTVAKTRLLTELFLKYDFRFTKGIFPKSEPSAPDLNPGLDVSQYRSYIDIVHEHGSEIAYHSHSPLAEATADRRVSVTNQTHVCIQPDDVDRPRQRIVSLFPRRSIAGWVASHRAPERLGHNELLVVH